MSYPLVDGSNKYTSTIFRTKLADTYEIEDGKTVTTFDAAAAVAQYESTPHEDDVTGGTMCSLDKLMTFGIDIPSGAMIYNVMVKVAPIETSKKITGCVYLNEDYHALIVNGRFIAQPHVDNGTGFCVACKGAINK